jgi:hypothetical protein
MTCTGFEIQHTSTIDATLPFLCVAQRMWTKLAGKLGIMRSEPIAGLNVLSWSVSKTRHL